MSVFDGSWAAEYVIFVEMDFGDVCGRLGWLAKLMGGSCLDLIMNSSAVWGMDGVTCSSLVRGLAISLGQTLGFLCFIFTSFYLLSFHVGILSPFFFTSVISLDELLRGDLIQIWYFFSFFSV